MNVFNLAFFKIGIDPKSCSGNNHQGVPALILTQLHTTLSPSWVLWFGQLTVEPKPCKYSIDRRDIIFTQIGDGHIALRLGSHNGTGLPATAASSWAAFWQCRQVLMLDFFFWYYLPSKLIVRLCGKRRTFADLICDCNFIHRGLRLRDIDISNVGWLRFGFYTVGLYAIVPWRFQSPLSAF